MSGNFFRENKRPISAFFVLLVFLLSLGVNQRALASSDPLLEFLAQNQLSSGALAEVGSTDPRQDLTAWAAISFASAGYDPATVRDTPKDPSLVDYLKTDACNQSSTQALERTIMALNAANFDFSALTCDLPGELEKTVLPDGSFNSDIISTVYGVLTLKSLGKPVDEQTVNYIISSQKIDGGFEPYSPWGTESTFTAQTIQALMAAGVDKNNQVIVKARQYLKSLQTDNGGFRYQSWSSDSNSTSDAAALEAIYSLGESPDDPLWLNGGKSTIDDLARFRNDDDSFKYDLDLQWGNVTPVFTSVSGQVELALNKMFLPLKVNQLTPFEVEEHIIPSPEPSVSPLSSQTAISSVSVPFVHVTALPISYNQSPTIDNTVILEPPTAPATQTQRHTVSSDQGGNTQVLQGQASKKDRIYLIMLAFFAVLAGFGLGFNLMKKYASSK